MPLPLRRPPPRCRAHVPLHVAHGVPARRWCCKWPRGARGVRVGGRHLCDLSARVTTLSLPGSVCVLARRSAIHISASAERMRVCARSCACRSGRAGAGAIRRRNGACSASALRALPAHHPSSRRPCRQGRDCEKGRLIRPRPRAVHCRGGGGGGGQGVFKANAVHEEDCERDWLVESDDRLDGTRLSLHATVPRPHAYPLIPPHCTVQQVVLRGESRPWGAFARFRENVLGTFSRNPRLGRAPWRGAIPRRRGQSQDGAG